MTTVQGSATASASLSASSTSCGCGSAGNPTNASTTMVGGQVQFENDSYRITMGDDNSVHIENKLTGEDYLVWGDPHVKVDGEQAFDFWGTTTFTLDDGTKLTIETTPSTDHPGATLTSKVTITNGDYGVRVTGVDSNTHGDLKFEEAAGWGRVLDAVVDDGNVLYENTWGKGFLGLDAQGRVRRVDQQFIDSTDLTKGGKADRHFDEALRRLTGLLGVVVYGVALGGRRQEKTQPKPSNAPAPAPFVDGWALDRAQGQEAAFRFRFRGRVEGQA